jgi:hypothetical protein
MVSWSGSSNVQSADAAWVERGLDSKFISRTLAEYANMGFAKPVSILDVDQARQNGEFGEEAKTTHSALFSMSRGSGGSYKCVVAMSAGALPNAPERRLAHSVESFGATKSQAWQAMFRHELGHCALGEISKAVGQPDVFLSEPFADVFSLSWGRLAEGEGYIKAMDAYGEARRRVSGGAHQTSRDIQRWRASTDAGSPCRQAWRIAPLDGRTAEAACPVGLSGVAAKVKAWFSP